MRLAWLAVLPLAVWGNFHAGDFVQTSRKSQYTGARTHWHDLLGRHCPRFGQDNLVLIPLPRPKDYRAVGDYKLQLSFDHERLTTAWLPIIAAMPSPMAASSGVNAVPENVHVPFIDVELTRRGEQLLRATAKSVRVPDSLVPYFVEHPTILEEYKDATMWPKHVLVRYQWRSIDQLDSDRGLLVLVYSGLLALCTVMFSVVSTHKTRLAEFMRDMVTDEGEGKPSGEKGD